MPNEPTPEAQAKHVDFFISHASGDAEWAEWIDQVLRRAGYSTITDLYEFRAGENFILLMENALTQAEKLLLIWSPKARDRYMVEVEWSGAMARNRNRVIPVIVQECEVPAVLSATLHVDLTGFIDGQEASGILLEALQGRPRPTGTVRYPRGAMAASMPFSAELQQRVASTVDRSGQSEASPQAFSLDSYIFARPHHATFAVTAQTSEVWMVAKGFESFLHHNARQIEQSVSRGTKFRFLMHDPSDNELMRMMALTSYSNRSVDDVRARLQGAVEQIHQLASGGGNAVELRLASWPIVTGCTFFRPNDDSSTVYVEIFGYRISLNERHALSVVRARDPQLFSYLRDNFLSQWRDAKRVIWDD